MILDLTACSDIFPLFIHAALHKSNFCIHPGGIFNNYFLCIHFIWVFQSYSTAKHTKHMSCLPSRGSYTCWKADQQGWFFSYQTKTGNLVLIKLFLYMMSHNKGSCDLLSVQKFASPEFGSEVSVNKPVKLKEGWPENTPMSLNPPPTNKQTPSPQPQPIRTKQAPPSPVAPPPLGSPPQHGIQGMLRHPDFQHNGELQNPVRLLFLVSYILPSTKLSIEMLSFNVWTTSFLFIYQQIRSLPTEIRFHYGFVNGSRTYLGMSFDLEVVIWVIFVHQVSSWCNSRVHNANKNSEIRPTWD